MANGDNQFNWDSYKENVNNLAIDVAKAHRTMRPLFKLYGQGGLTTNIVRNRINREDLKNNLISIPTDKSQNLTPALLTCDIKIERERFGNMDSINRAVKEAAYHIAVAEDKVILLGGLLKGKEGSLAPVQVKHLEAQEGLLSKPPPKLKTEQSVADSIRHGFQTLIKNGRKGNFVAVVSEELYTQATKGRENATDTEYSEFNKVIIQEGGFHYSEALGERSGVMMSLSGESIMIAVPMDISVQLLKVEGDAFLQVVEQICLVIDVEGAVVPLTNTPVSNPSNND